jgi:serine/threonine protein kinase
LAWIQHLLSALEWLKCQGYTHGDLKIQNIGIDDNNRLQLFDFSSIRQHSEEGFNKQVLKDHFWLATCIHFLASGVDPIAKANSSKEVQETLRKLKGGLGTVETKAKEFEEVIQAGWTGAFPTTSFSAVRKAVAEIVQKTSSSEVYRSEDLSTSYPLAYDDVALERDLRWMDEECYRTSCQEMGFPTPDDMWS